MRYTPEQIAALVHEAIRGLQLIQGDSLPSPPWETAPAEMREWGIDGVRRALRGETPRQHHEAWVEWMKGHGWTYGLVKDPVRKTHPALQAWSDLPAEQRQKDELGLLIITWAATLS